MNRPASLLLASASPRRQQLLAEAGYRFAVRPAGIDEGVIPHLSPRETALHHAKAKALHLARVRRDSVVLGADTLVAIGGEALGKPRDLDEARAMLRRLAGRTHQVHTGVWLSCWRAGLSFGFLATSDVEFHALGPEDIEEYLRRVHTLDKAGAYAAQEEGARIIRRIRGSLTNVIGLPLEPLAPALERFDLHPDPRTRQRRPGTRKGARI